MRVRLGHGPGWVAAAACSVLLATGSLSACDADRAASARTNPGHASTSPDTTDVRVLQLNLCNSGRAACYSGGDAVDLAVGLVHDHRPDVVTLNEVCRDDVTVFERTMSAAHPAAAVAAAFAPAPDRLTHRPVTCRDGEDFGDGVLVAAPRSSQAATTGNRSRSGVYPVQDAADPEERVWVCIDVATRFAACTTHAASTDAAVALSQCRHLLTSVVQGAARAGTRIPLVLGADLNLPATGSPGVEACLPGGYQHTDDGGVQDVVVSPGAELRSRTVVDMEGTTDHPGLLVDVALPRP
ncbi:hypothetical protein GCM10023258_03320 [Terrabacter aeriphilus]|uniref:Endonuclease/exonuclease/phosphatase family protein n=1 Tax=Terrabacter aeriphilus TaxID=515662 RepID=A0ABP9J3Y1_9MICO